MPTLVSGLVMVPSTLVSVLVMVPSTLVSGLVMVPSTLVSGLVMVPSKFDLRYFLKYIEFITWSIMKFFLALLHFSCQKR